MPLREIIQKIHNEGAIDIRMMLLSSPHFLPPIDDHELALPRGENRPSFQPGYLDLETSGNLLSHRPASRRGDDIVIWSLLMSDKTIFYDAEIFWTSMQGEAFKTSAQSEWIITTAININLTYLISDTPRLATRGLGWAPISPTLHSTVQYDQSGLNSFDSHSAIGAITHDGLVADWRIWIFSNGDDDDGLLLDKNFPLGSESGFPKNLSQIRMRFLHGYRLGAILTPREMPANRERWELEGRMRHRLVVVCGTGRAGAASLGERMERYTLRHLKGGNIRWDEHRDSVQWEWKGVHPWDNDEPMPRWRTVRELLIV